MGDVRVRVSDCSPLPVALRLLSLLLVTQILELHRVQWPKSLQIHFFLRTARQGPPQNCSGACAAPRTTRTWGRPARSSPLSRRHLSAFLGPPAVLGSVPHRVLTSRNAPLEHVQSGSAVERQLLPARPPTHQRLRMLAHFLTTPGIAAAHRPPRCGDHLPPVVTSRAYRLGPRTVRGQFWAYDPHRDGQLQRGLLALGYALANLPPETLLRHWRTYFRRRPSGAARACRRRGCPQRARGDHPNQSRPTRRARSFPSAPTSFH